MNANNEVFYSLSSEDILRQAEIMKIARKKLTFEVMQRIKHRVKDEIEEYISDVILDAISDAVHEKEASVNR